MSRKSPATSQRKSHRPGRTRLQLEVLEDRTLLNGHTLATASLVSLTEPNAVAGTLAFPQDVDLFKVQLNAGEQVTAVIDAQKIGSQLPSYLRVFDSNGNPLAVPNLFAGSPDPYVTFQAPTSGSTTFYVGVSWNFNTGYDPTTAPPPDPPFTPPGRFSYNLNIFPENGNTLATATPVNLQSSATVSGDLTNPQAVDLFQVQAAAGDTVTATVAAQSIGSNLISLVRVFDSNGNEVARSAGTSGTDAAITFTVLSPTPYYIGISWTSNGGYDPNLPLPPNPPVIGGNYFYNLDLQRHGHSLATATPLDLQSTSTATASGDLRFKSDVDLYRFQATSGDTITASVAASSIGSSLQSVLRLFDSSGNQLAINGMPGTEPHFTVQVPPGGPAGLQTFYVGVSNLANSAYNPNFPAPPDSPVAGSQFYTLKLQRQGHTLATATPLTVQPTGTVSGTLPFASDVDFYQIQVTPGNSVTASINAQSLGSQLQSVLRVFDSNGNMVAFAGPTSPFSPDPRVTFLAMPPPGPPSSGPVTYYIGVSWIYNGGYDPTVPPPPDPPNPPAGDFSYTLNLVQVGHSLATAAPILLPSSTTLSGSLDFGGPDVDLYRIQLQAGDRLTAAIHSLSIGSQLRSALRLFDSNGQQIAFNQGNPPGQSDPAVSFLAPQLPGSQTYYLGVSWFFNTFYDPQSTPPLPPFFPPNNFYELQLDATPPDLVGSGFALSQKTAVQGDQLGITYTVTNAGGLSSQVGFQVDFRLSAGTFFNATEPLLATRWIPVLGPGQSFTETFQTTPPYVPPGTINIGMVIDPTHAVTLELDTGDNANQARGADWDSLLILDSQTAEEAQLGLALNGQVTGSLSPNQALLFPFVVSPTNAGRLLATLHALGATGVATRLSLLHSDFSVLTQSDGVSATNPDDLIDQHLLDGQSYYLQVQSLNNWAGTFTLTTQYDVSTPPNQPLRVPGINGPVAGLDEADFNGDGVLDLVTLDRSGDNFINQLSVMLGLGDGTFQPARNYTWMGYSVATVLVTADINGDGRLDLAALSPASPDFGPSFPSYVSVLLGNGDGTFQPVQQYAVDPGAFQMVVSDFNSDGCEDLGILNSTTGPLATGSVTLLLGKADGTFRSPRSYGVGAFSRQLPDPNQPAPVVMVAGDFNGDGHVDLATHNQGLDFNTFFNNVTVLLGNGDGTFQQIRKCDLDPAQRAPQASLVLDDFDKNGSQDLVVSGMTDIAVLQGVGKGLNWTFEVQKYVFPTPGKLVLADVNGDGVQDIAAVAGSEIAVLLGNRNGSFQQTVSTVVPSGNPGLLPVGDFNGDGRSDLIIGPFIFLGNANGTFQQEPGQLRVEVGPGGVLVVGDFNGDGHQDLASSPIQPGSSVFLLFGNGDGTFQQQQPVRKPANVLADFNGDGHLDVAGLDNQGARGYELSVLLGNGDGTFQPVQQTLLQFSMGYLAGPSSILTGDVNEDGRLDVTFVGVLRTDAPDGSVVLSDNGMMFVLLGNGDGSFQQPLEVSLAGRPLGPPVLGDFTGKHHLDLAVATAGPDPVSGLTAFYVSVLLSNGDGTFRPEQVYRLAAAPDTQNGPTQLFMGDITGDGHLDLATASYYGMSVLLGNGDGTFQPERRSAFGITPGSVFMGEFSTDSRWGLLSPSYVGSPSLNFWIAGKDGSFQLVQSIPFSLGLFNILAGDFTGDHRLSIAAVGFDHDSFQIVGVYFFKGNGDGTFQLPQLYSTGSTGLLAGNFNGNGNLDLAVVGQQSIDVLPGAGDGTFAFNQLTQSALPSFSSISMLGDFNGDGLPDLLTTGPSGLSVLLNTGDGTFVSATDATSSTHTAPLVADINCDGTPDVVIVNAQGQVLFRAGQPGAPGSFAPPVIVNPDPNFAARDVAIVRTPDRTLVAALDYLGHAVSFYALGANGLFGRIGSLNVPGTLPSRIVAGDLNEDGRNDGRDDIIVVTAGSKQAFVWLQNPDGTFNATANYQARLGVNPVAVALVDVHRNGRPAIVVAHSTSGEVDVLTIEPGKSAVSKLAYHAGQGLFDVQSFNSGTALASLQGTSSIAAGFLTGGAFPDLIVTNNLTNKLGLLPADGTGGYFNVQTLVPGVHPDVVVAVDFNDDGIFGLAILDKSAATISIYLGNGRGGFTLKGTVSAGNSPTDLTVADVNGDGKPDLLVGNKYGDVLILLGNGDGTFLPFVRADQAVPFVIANANGDVILANQSIDQAMSQIRQPGTTNFTTGSFDQQGNGLIAPGAVVLADLTRNGLQDLIVANSGSNDILVYMRQPDGSFVDTPQSFFTGDNPVSVTVQDLNDDNIPDVAVANRGSNDVSVLFGSGTKDLGTGIVGNWTLTAGPRLKAGNGPLGVVIQDQNGDKIPDMLVSNSDGTITALPGIGSGGVGTGFFNDTGTQSLDLGSSILQALTNGFVLTTAGIFQVTANGLTATEVFASTTLTAFTTSGTGIVAGFEDGSLGLLTKDGNGQFTESLIFRDAQLTDPSALQVVDNNGKTEIYATTSGLSRVFVFGLADGIPVETRGQQADVTPLGLVLIASLVTSAEGDALGDSGGDFSLVFGLGNHSGNEAALALLTNLLTGSDGAIEEDIEYEAEEARFSLNDLVIGVEEALRTIRLQLRPSLESGGDSGMPGGMLDAFDKVFRNFDRVSDSMAGMWEEALRRGDVVMDNSSLALGKIMQQLGYAGMDTAEEGLHATLLSIWRALRETGRSLLAPSIWHGPPSSLLRPAVNDGTTTAVGNTWDGLITAPTDPEELALYTDGWFAAPWSLLSEGTWKEALGAVMITGFWQLDPFPGAWRQRGDRERPRRRTTGESET